MVESVIFGVLYVASVIGSYLAVRRWHIATGLTPTLFDAIFIFIPIANVGAMISCLMDMPRRKTIAKRFFRMK